MSLFRWISEASFLSLSLGLFLVLYISLRALVETASNLWRRLFASWTVLRLRDLGILREEKNRRRLALDWRRAGIVLLALSAR